MNTRKWIVSLALLGSGALHAQAPMQPLPNKWTATGSAGPDSTQCTAGVDAALVGDGQRNLTIACTVATSAAIRQAFEGGPLRGKRYKFSAWIKADGLGDGPGSVAGMFVDSGMGGKTFANVRKGGSPGGSNNWEYREIVVNVGRSETWLNVGIWLNSRGQVWARDFKFEEVVVPVPLKPMPAVWSPLGGGGPQALPGQCEIGVDSQISDEQQQVFSVRCFDSQQRPAFGGSRQTIAAARYRGKRVRVSGWVMAKEIEGVAGVMRGYFAGEGGLWLAIESPTDKEPRTDRMQDRALKGTTGWEYRDFVADIPDDSTRLMVGFWMQGKGQIWVRDLVIEEVPQSVPSNFLRVNPGAAAGPDLSLQ